MGYVSNLQQILNNQITDEALIPKHENPAVKAGLFRVYGQWDNYRTNFEEFREMYLFGIQVDNRLTKEAGL